MKKILLTIIYFLFIQQLLGQGHGYFVIRPQPENAIIRLDSSKINPFQVYNLNPGKYVLKVWAQGYKLHIDTISIETNKSTNSILKLDRSVEYLRYRADVKKQRRGFRITIGTALFLATAGIILNDKATDFEDKTKNNKSTYLSSVTPSEIANAKENYNNSLDDFKTYRSYRNVAFIAVAGTAVIGSYLSYRYYKNHKSVYKEDVPQLSSITPYYDPMLNTGNLTAIFLIK